MKFTSTLFLGLCFFLLPLTTTQAQTTCNTSPTPTNTNVLVNTRTVDVAYDLDGDGMLDFGYTPTGSVNDFCGGGNNSIALPVGTRLTGFDNFPNTMTSADLASGVITVACESRTPVIWMVSLSGSSGIGFFAVDASNNIIAVGTTTESSLTWTSFTDGCPDVAAAPVAATAPIPTMSQWGLMVFALLIMNLSVFFVQRSVLA